jgi:pilus assembly protein FimV
VGALGITSLRAWIVAASLLSICAVSHAAGLGKLNVTSALGEPLNAEVELVAEKNEIGSLAARLASRDAFERAGLAYSNLLTGVKVSIEKRAGGEPYLRLTSTQPVTEPFLDLLIELTWFSGRINREFTVLLDPPGVIAEREKQKAAAAEVRAAPTPPQPKAEPVPAPDAETAKPETAKAEEPVAQAPAEPAPTEPQPAPVPTAPVETIGGSQPTLLNEGSALPSWAKSAPGADAYGPVKSGDTLGKIASATKPSDVSLEQILVLLVQNNPDAFSGKNMNRLKTGKILQLPSTDQFASISEADARKEVKVQARDWRAYREQVAAAAGQAAPAEQPAQQAVSGKVGAAVEDKAASAKEQPKEILKLSKNEPAAGATAAAPSGGEAKAAARVRALEEEVVARDKAVNESNDRVTRLEKQIKDLQALVEIKNKDMADLQKPAVTPPAATPQAPAQKAIPEKPTVPATPAPVTPAAPEVKPATPAAPVSPAPTPAPKSESAPAPSQPVPVQPKPAPVKVAPVPAPEPSLMNQVLDQPAYLGAAIGVLIIIGALAVRAVKRRRESESDAEESGPARVFAETSGAAAFSTDGKVRASAEAAAETSEEVDPVAEAEIFLAYGRDAQAEELLKEALESSPKRHEIHLKLLQIYANRKDAKSFEKVARDLQQATGGAGELWNQAVVLGYQVDPGNSRYAAGKSAAGAAAFAGAAAAASAAAENVDFNIGSEDSQATTTDIDLGEGGSQFDRTQIIDPAAEAAHDSTVSFESGARPAMDFNVDLPSSGLTAPEPEGPHTASASGLDFDIDLNTFSAPSGNAAAAPIEPAAGGGLDFDMSGFSLDAPGEPKMESSAAAPEIDLSGISLDLGTETAPAISPTGKNDHWYDVQTKFDLAKAYQEMGDKDGAREILTEVLQEGDAEQKTAAKSVLSSLDS